MSAVVVAAGHGSIQALVALVSAVDPDPIAVVVGSATTAGEASASGAGRVLWVDAGPALPLEAYAGAVAEIVAGLDPAPRLICGSTRDVDRVLLAAIAVSVGAPLISRPLVVEAAGGGVRVAHGVGGGIAERTVESARPVVLCGDGPPTPADASNPAPLPERGRSSAPIERLTASPSPHLVIESRTPHDEPPVDLAASARIVAVGRGVPNLDALAEVRALASDLDADLACSRPLSDALGWLPHDRCVGLTGRRVAPVLYLALGISGQLQHVVGARGAEVVVVVNSDPSAPYFGEADFGIVGDLGAVIPALRRALT